MDKADETEDGAVSAGSTERPAPRKDCQLFLPGHDVHFIQARKSWQDESSEEGRLLAVRDMDLEVRVGGETRHYRHHDPEWVIHLADERGPSVAVQERWHVLGFPDAGSTALVCIATADDEWTPCRQTPRAEPSSADELVERARDAGGFYWHPSDGSP